MILHQHAEKCGILQLQSHRDKERAEWQLLDAGTLGLHLWILGPPSAMVQRWLPGLGSVFLLMDELTPNWDTCLSLNEEDGHLASTHDVITHLKTGFRKVSMWK